ncbi:MAG TPA: reverse transcriptase domain-containing protein [Xanthobacteraceae bacterium]|jgi:hypothetical protein|nr:reverse transcriptase domain-containing protein [Xanthobacteraceae bacterium]
MYQAAKIENYDYKYRSRGKWIFVPNERCKRKGERILSYFSRVKFPSYFYHYQPGGHVAALHAHLQNSLFFKIDIQNFYYSIARMRVTRVLRNRGFVGAHTAARWSCVANPLAGPRHVLPIGFLQSPLLASLVLLKSPVADAIERALDDGVCISVYLDDFIGSHNDNSVLTAAYDNIRHACVGAGLIPNAGKLVPPNAAITVFNCDLVHGAAQVTEARVNEFMEKPRNDISTAAFQAYRQRVASQNL